MLDNFYMVVHDISFNQLQWALNIDAHIKAPESNIVAAIFQSSNVIHKITLTTDIPQSLTRGTLKDFYTWMGTVYPHWWGQEQVATITPTAVITNVCNCKSLLSGHDSGCAYYKQDRAHGIWGIKNT